MAAGSLSLVLAPFLITVPTVFTDDNFHLFAILKARTQRRKAAMTSLSARLKLNVRELLASASTELGHPSVPHPATNKAVDDKVLPEPDSDNRVDGKEKDQSDAKSHGNSRNQAKDVCPGTPTR